MRLLVDQPLGLDLIERRQTHLERTVRLTAPTEGTIAVCLDPAQRLQHLQSNPEIPFIRPELLDQPRTLTEFVDIEQLEQPASLKGFDNRRGQVAVTITGRRV